MRSILWILRIWAMGLQMINIFFEPFYSHYLPNIYIYTYNYLFIYLFIYLYIYTDIYIYYNNIIIRQTPGLCPEPQPQQHNHHHHYNHHHHHHHHQTLIDDLQ